MVHHPRRIAVTTPLLAIPPTYFVTEHAEQLLRPGTDWVFRVHPLASHVAEGATRIPVVPALPNVGSFSQRSRIASATMPLQALHVIRERPDLIHQHHGVWTAGAAAAARRLRIPMITTFHGTDAVTAALPHPQGLQRVHRHQARLAFSRSDRILAVSEHLRGVALAAGAPADRTLVHYQGIDTDVFTPSPVREDRPPAIYVLSALIPRKRIDLAIRASQQLMHDVDHELHIIGDGPLRSELSRLASDTPHITFHGQVDRSRVLEALRSADLLVLPSRAEAAGLVLLEAQACGVPVVVTGGDGKQEMLQDGVTGTVTAPDPTPVELARALHAWLPDSSRMREQVARAARDFVVTQRSVRVGAERLVQIYDEVLGAA